MILLLLWIIAKVPYSDWWEMIETHKCRYAPEAIFIHPGAEDAALAGNATIALEIVEDLPDVDCIIVPYGSGSVCTGIACGIKELSKEPGNEKVNIINVSYLEITHFCKKTTKGQRARFCNDSLIFI